MPPGSPRPRHRPASGAPPTSRASSQSMCAASERWSSTDGPGLGEVVPAPVDERLDALAHAAHQGGVHAQPGCERNRAVELVAMLADLGHGGATPDHRHDALVLVVERFAVLPPISARMFADIQAALQRNRPELRVRHPSGPGMFAMSPTTYTPGKPSTVRSGLTSMRPPRPCGSPLTAAGAAAIRPPAQATQRVWIVVPSDSRRGQARSP